MNKNKTGLVLGYFFALLHLIWAILVALIPVQLQTGINWVFKLHGLEPVWTITSMTWLNAIMLVIMTFVSGYIIGWAFAWIHDLGHKK